ncbi:MULTISPECIES: PRC-barrel domain-containing protein [unclassified Bradyrhizobium]|uniref:PRC-barrel domain-containing protein n=1 Tax=unclassified Bradyrhizobium TaxID=2631580 RepID=UPI0024795202|nr:MULTISPECIES: PRC-barrel domain-containing protein [unclassified Bradyrhizobium]WGR69894.1 PRC-barrel domain-containing protein [Bradyrhizobium sp. ISRA426]WGR81951.1 PRC-barrel domain-containing protein [Bradyrhizobium sp. ISRA430]WGR85137.1 PRC-barrel domain-containing protein [Bradyrhizobium sp. ISRA432]
MLIKSIAAGLAGTALLATVAFAQSPTATGDKAPTASATTTSASNEWRASKMAGLRVYNDSNENIGSINDLLMDKSGAIKMAVIGVGGFLGMGEHLVAIPYEKLKFSEEAVAYNTGTGTSPTGAKPPASTTTGAATGTDKTAAAPAKSSKWYPDHAVFNASKDDLKNMPEFKYSE